MLKLARANTNTLHSSWIIYTLNVGWTASFKLSRHCRLVMETGSWFQLVKVSGKNECWNCWYIFSLQWYVINLTLSTYRGDHWGRLLCGTATRLYITLNMRIRSAALRRSSNVGQFSCCYMVETLDGLWYLKGLFSTNRAAFLWTCSSCLSGSFAGGSKWVNYIPIIFYKLYSSS